MYSYLLKKIRKKESTVELDTLKYFSGKVLVAFLVFPIVPLLTRILGVKKFGVYSILLAIGIWGFQLSGGWLQQSILRFNKKYDIRNKYGDYLATLKRLKAFSIIVDFIVITILLFFLKRNIFSLVNLTVVFIYSIARCFFMWNIATAQAELKPGIVVFSEAIAQVSVLLFILIFFLFNLKIELFYIILFLAFGLVMGSVFSAFKLGTLQRKYEGIYNSNVASELFNYGLPLGLWFTLIAANNYLGRFILNELNMSVDLGIFSAVQEFIVKGITILLMPFIWALHPRVMAKWEEGKADVAKKEMIKTVFYQFCIGVAITAGVYIFYPLIKLLLFGKSLVVSSSNLKSLFIIIAFAMVLQNMALVAHKGIEIYRKTYLMAILIAVSFTFNFIVSWMTVRSFGYLGVAFGLLVGNFVYLCFVSIISFFLMKRKV